MSKLGRQQRRKKILEERKAARKEYKQNRELGPCYLSEKGCGNNGDFIESCRFCDYKVQVCTAHRPLGQQKAAQHVFAKHPVKAMGITTMGVLRGQKFFG